MITTKNKIHSFFFSEVHFLNLEIIRILFYLLMLVQFKIPEIYIQFSKLPVSFYSPTGLLLNKGSIEFIAHYSFEILVILKFFILCSLFDLFGKVSRWIVFIFVLLIFNIPYAFQANLFLATPLVFLNFILALSKPRTLFSLDRILFKKPTLPKMSDEYCWPIKFGQIIFVLVFLNSAIIKIKLSGIEWIFSNHLLNIMICSPFYRGDVVIKTIMDLKLNYFFSHFPVLIRYFSMLALLAELLTPLSLFRFRFSKIPLMTVALMQIGSIFLIFINPENNLALYLFWINWHKMISKNKAGYAFKNDWII